MRPLKGKFLASLGFVTTLVFSALVLSGCVTSSKGSFVVQKPGVIDFAVSTVPTNENAERSLEMAAYDICSTVNHGGFKITKRDLRGIVLLARVECTPNADAFTTMKYGSACRKIQVRPSSAYPNGFDFDYVSKR